MNIEKEVYVDGSVLRCRWRLHAEQRVIWESKARFLVVVCGAGWGKTYLAARWLVEGALETGKLTQWIAPTYPLTQMGWEQIESFMIKGLGEAKLSDRVWQLMNGGRVQLKSAEDPDALRGRHIPRRVIEEASLMPDDVYNIVRARVLTTEGQVMFIFTPKGKGHWTYELYQRGLDENEPEWQSFHFPQTPKTLLAINPKLQSVGKAKSELAKARRDMGDLWYRQEILADFVEETANVFRNVRMRSNSQEKEPEDGKRYVLGVDVAQLMDYTVIYVLDEERKMVFGQRLSQVPYTMITERIAQISELYNHAPIVIDQSGVGKPVYDALLERDGTGEVVGFTFSMKSKTDLIMSLIAAFEDENFSILPDQQLIYELETYEYQMTRFGNFTFSAPAKKHDDCVIALALANHGYLEKLAEQGELMYWV